MRKPWILVVALLVAVLAIPVALVSSPTLLLPALSWGVERFTKLRLEINGLELRPRTVGLGVESLHLYQQGVEGPALISVLGFKGESRLRDLWERDLVNTRLSADSVIVYVAADDAAEDPTPEQWLHYLRFLPQRLDVATVHVINQHGDVSIFPVDALSGRRTGRDGFSAELRADINGTPLDVALSLTAISQQLDRGGVNFTARVESPDSATEAHLEGMFEADAESLRYDVTVNTAFPEISGLLRAFPDAPPLAGALSLRGRLTGDMLNYQLSDAGFELDNRPAYHFQASGDLQRSDNADPSLSLIASGEMDSLAYFFHWLDLDLSPLGSIRASIALSGTLAATAVDQLTIVTESSEGLWITLNGSSGPGSLGSTQLPAGADFSLYAYAPGLAVLEPWLGQPVGFDAGPWQLSARLVEAAGALSVKGIQAQMGTASGTLLQASGDIASIDLDRLRDPAGVQGIDLALSLASPELSVPAGWLEQTMPTGIALEARGALTGSGAELTLSAVSASIRHEQLELAFNDASLRLYQAEGYRPRDGQARLELRAPPLRDALDSVGGNIRLSANDTGHMLSQLTLTSPPTSPLQLQLDGSATYSGEQNWQGKFTLDFGSEDGILLEALSGLPLASTAGFITLTMDPASVALSSSIQVGATELALQVDASHSGGALTGLSASLESPLARLHDLGLQATGTEEGDFRPADKLEPVTENTTLQRLLELAPDYPLDLRLVLGGLQGNASRFDDIKIHITGADTTYLLREFDFVYAGAPAQIRGVIDISASPPGFSIAGQADSIPLNTLSRDLGIQTDISGALNMRGGISAQGLTGAELLRQLDGTVGIALDGATVEGAAYDVLASGILTWLFSGAAREESTYLDCVMAQFSLEDGIARSSDIFVESPNMIANGSGEFDFPARTLDLTLTPRSKSRSVQIPSRISLRGDMASPRTSVSPIATTLDMSSEALLFLPRLVLRVLGITKPEQTVQRSCVIATTK